MAYGLQFPQNSSSDLLDTPAGSTAGILGNYGSIPAISPISTNYGGLTDYGKSDLFSSMAGPAQGNGISLSPSSYIPGTGGGASPSFLDGFLGTPAKQGWGGLALQGAQGAGNLFMGMQQYGMAKDALATAKEQMDRNYNAQKATTNASMSDRQNARVAANPGAYISTSDYMNQNGIK